MSYTLITAPATEPVTEALLREHATLDSNVSSALLTLYLKAARASAEGITGRAILPQTWEATFDAFSDALELAKPPVVSISSLSYYDTSGTLQVLSPTAYVLDARTLPGWVVPVYGESWPATQPRVNAVTVRFVSGYANEASVPDEIKHWIYARAAAAIDNRESVDKNGRLGRVEFIDSLLDPWCVRWSV